MRYFEHAGDFFKIAIWDESLSRALAVAGVITVLVGGSLIAAFAPVGRHSLYIGIGLTLLLTITVLNGGFVAYRDERRKQSPRLDGALSVEHLKWTCPHQRVDYQMAGVSCVSSSGTDISGVSVRLKEMAVLQDGKWVDLRRIQAFHEVTLCVSNDDFVSEREVEDIPPGSERKWIIVAKGEHENNGYIAAAHPQSRGMQIGHHSLHRLRLMIEAPGRTGFRHECFIELGTESADFVMNGVSQHIVVSRLAFVDTSDERVEAATDLVI